MTKRVLNKEYRNFSGGLVTEASPLTFPENTAVDIDNIVLEYDGTVKRRKGLSQVGSNLQNTLASSPTHQGGFVWKDAGGELGNDYYCVKLLDTLHIYSCDGTTSIDASPSISILLDNFQCDLHLGSTYSNVWGTILSTDFDLQFSAKGKFLFVTANHMIPFVVENYSTTSFRLMPWDIYVRDLDGADDGLSLTQQPASGFPAHRYNLRNQGWAKSQFVTYNTNHSVDPSNAEVPHVGWRPASNTANESWQSAQVNAYNFESTPAPKGNMWKGLQNSQVVTGEIEGFRITNIAYASGTGVWTFTIDSNHTISGGRLMFYNMLVSYVDTGGDTQYWWFNEEQYTGSTATTVTVQDTITNYSSGFTVVSYGFIASQEEYTPTHEDVFTPSTSAIFSGRVWVSGILGMARDAQTVAYVKSYKDGLICFSQMEKIQRQSTFFPKELRLCGTENSPTARDYNDPLDTDGGTITISDSGFIHKMIPLEKSLLVFAERGVWEIGPGSLGYFTATSYSLTKVSDIGVTETKSMLSADNLPFYKGVDGDIHALIRNPQTGRFEAQDLTETTIRSTIAGKTILKVAHDIENKRVVWLNDDNTALIMDLRLKVWYKWTFKDSGNTKVDMVYCPSLNSESRLVFIAHDASDNVQQFTLTDASFEDDGTDAAAYVVTGYELLDTSARDKQAVYITTHFNRTETQFIDDGGGGPLLDPQSGCQMKAQWDFDSTGDANRHSTAQQVYRLVRPYTAPAGPYPKDFDYGLIVVTTRNKVRGKGKALTLRFDSEAGKDMQLIGWSTSFTGNARD